jgi:shikimate kinase
MIPPAGATRCVALIGFMGAGKTTVGHALAKRLHWNFFDLDDVIEQREQQSVAQIFASSGEAAFRRMETMALRTLLQDRSTGSDLILALGGGAFIQPENRAVLGEARAITVLLDAPLEELRRRCTSERKVRPLAQQQDRFQEDRFAELFAARRMDYALAQFTVQTLDKTVDHIAGEIEQLLGHQQLGSQ